MKWIDIIIQVAKLVIMEVRILLNGVKKLRNGQIMTKEEVVIPEEFKLLYKQGTIRKLGDPCLETQSEPITRFDSILHKQAMKMVKAVQEFNGAGLAANQIGVNKRMFVIKDSGQILVMVNPIVNLLGDCDSDSVEGCLSVPSLWGTVKRHNSVEVKWQDLRGKFHEGTFEGFSAFVIQHEFDHTLCILHFTKFVPGSQYWEKPSV